MSEDKPAGTPKDTHYANLRRAHRDRKRTDTTGAASASQTFRPKRPSHKIAAEPAAEGRVKIYGLHAVSAALTNKGRRLHRLAVTRNALGRLGISEEAIPCPFDIVEPRRLDAEVGSDAVHQGIVLEADPLRSHRISELKSARLVLVLDQVTDPHNVGAIMRSATAFAADALLTTVRHSPQESGVLAKAASGALEHVPHVEVVNLADALQELSSFGFRTIGLDSEGDATFEDSLSGNKIAIVLGAEGKGLRLKTRSTVDALARLDMPGAIRSLNVSNAAAIALYATRRHLGS